MKTKSTYKILLILIMTALLSACSEDFLQQVPRLSQSNELSLSTYEGLQNATIGSYSLLCSQNWYGAAYVITADLKGGNAKRGPINSGRYVNEYLWNNSPTATIGLWDDAYSTIARVNNVINAIDDGFEEAGVTSDQLDVLKGEAQKTSIWPRNSMIWKYANTHNNLLLVPHIGGVTIESMEETEIFMAQKLGQFLQEKV